MKTVFLVMRSERHEGTDLLEIFSSVQAAQNFCLDYIKDKPYAKQTGSDSWSVGPHVTISVDEREVRDW